MKVEIVKLPREIVCPPHDRQGERLEFDFVVHQIIYIYIYNLVWENSFFICTQGKTLETH